NSSHAVGEERAVSVAMDEGIERGAAKGGSAHLVGIIQGKRKAAEAGRAFDLTPSEIEGWLDAGLSASDRAGGPA
ncbi:MAG: hypothetical protein AAFQ17_03165, partial [Pseudomonadota bacterium]